MLFCRKLSKTKKILLHDGGLYTVYEVIIENLDHLVIKFEE